MRKDCGRSCDRSQMRLVALPRDDFNKRGFFDEVAMKLYSCGQGFRI